MNQAFSKIWILIILIVFIAGGISAWQYLVAPEEEVVEDKTVDWNVYQNEEYGFEIKYPVDWWVAGESGAGGEGVLHLFSVNIQKGKQGPPGELCVGCPGLFINIYDKDFLKGVGTIEGSYWEIGEDVMIGDHLAKKALFRNVRGEYWTEEFFYMLQNNYDYEIRPSVPGIGGVGVNLEAEVNNVIPEFYQILSTFKFIEK